MTMDIYDQAVEYLSERAQSDNDVIWSAWFWPGQDKGGILFSHTDRSRSGACCGCLTQIRGGLREGPTPELTERIRLDTRIPTHGELITAEMLPVFAEWQRKIDAELGRPTPKKI